MSASPFYFRSRWPLFAKLRAFSMIFILFAPLLLINVFQALALPLRWLAPILWRRWNTLMAAIYWGYIAWMLVHANKIPIHLGGYTLDSKENALVICNHQSAFDTLLLLVWAQRSHRVGTLRFFAKDILKYIPGPGWGMYFLDCLFLKRSWQDDALNLRRTMDRYKEARLPYCWIIFPEGTRITPDKLAKSQERSTAKGRPAFQHVLSPHARGFSATIEALGQDLHKVIDITIFYPEGTPSVWQLMQGARVPVQLEAEAFDAREFSHYSLESWLEQRFLLKDRRLAAQKKSE